MQLELGVLFAILLGASFVKRRGKAVYCFLFGILVLNFVAVDIALFDTEMEFWTAEQAGLMLGFGIFLTGFLL